MAKKRVRLTTPPPRSTAAPSTNHHRTKHEPPPQAPSAHPRKLQIYAFDPILDTGLETWQINRIEVAVPNEPLLPGPRGEYLDVIDIDPESGLSYTAVDLDDPEIRAQHGLSPAEDDPCFHQQMVYAVAMTTIRNFERAIGRVVLWRALKPGEPGYPKPAPPNRRDVPVRALRVYPHAVRGRNAFYDPDRRALLFGYFQAPKVAMGRNLPGGTVFTCLSHDIIAHETTHALLDGLHPRFLEPTNGDALAFHEGFADIVALLQHFSFPAVVRNQIAKARGDLLAENLLGELAMQFGEAIGNYGALRSAIGAFDKDAGRWKPLVPNASDYQRTTEPHDRGAILVAAVFEAFQSIYASRTRDLLRLATGGTGRLPEGEIHPDLVDRLAREASRTASHVLTMCIRALDYCPPVDITFGDYLRALITSDYEIVSDDDLNYRVAIVEAFRRRGLYPSGVSSLSPESLLWASPGRGKASGSDEHSVLVSLLVRDLLKEYHKSLAKLIGRDGGGWWAIDANRTLAAEFAQNLRSSTHSILTDAINTLKKKRGSALEIERLGQSLGVVLGDPSLPFEIQSARPVRRVGPDGDVSTELLIEITQSIPCCKQGMPVLLDDSGVQPPSVETFDTPFRGGCTLIIDPKRQVVRYCIGKGLLKPERYRKQQMFLAEHTASAAAANFGPGSTFARLHGFHAEEGL